MPNCDKYQNMTPKERTEYVGSLIHSVISDDEIFEAGIRLIKKATKKGLFEGVKINPIEENKSEQTY